MDIKNTVKLYAEAIEHKIRTKVDLKTRGKNRRSMEEKAVIWFSGLGFEELTVWAARRAAQPVCNSVVL